MFKEERDKELFLEEPVMAYDTEIDSIDMKKIKNINLDCDYTLQGIKLKNTKTKMSGTGSNSNLKLTYSLDYVDENVVIHCNLIDQDDNIIVTNDYNIPRETFVSDFLDLVQRTKRIRYKNLECIKTGVEELKQLANKISMRDNIILIGDELNHDIFIYDENDKKIGLANRILFSSKTDIVLCEAIILEEHESSYYKIKIILNENQSIDINDVRLKTETTGEIKYMSMNTNKSFITLVDGEYETNTIKCVLNIPPASTSTSYLEQALKDNNNVSALNKYYKFNKKMNINKININKYMLI